MIALFSISQMYATDFLQFKLDSKQKTNFELQTFYKNNHNHRKGAKNITNMINGYELPKLIEPLILNGVYIYKFIEGHKKIDIYNKKVRIFIEFNYLNPKVGIYIEIEKRKENTQ